MRNKARGFSLLEVVAAIGVFALGIIVVIGLFAPLARSVGTNADAEAAARLADAIRVELMQRVARAHSFAPVAALLKNADALQADGVDSRSDGQLLFVSRDGTRIGERGAARWENSDHEEFFEVTLVRNTILSPPSEDATATVLVYTARIRWPAFSLARETLFINGSIRR